MTTPSRTSRALAALTMAAGLLAPSASTAAGPEATPKKVFVGYLFREPREIDFSLYTHICHAFLDADRDGRLEKARYVPSRDLTAQAHKAGVKVLISLGGWGWDEQFAAIVAHPEAENRYFHSVMEIIDQFDYDGIDLDWEYPDTKDEVLGFERLTRRFRKALDDLGRRKGRQMPVTMAASANPGTLKWLDTDFLLETMDWINVMTYDFAGDWSDVAGHNAPLFASSKRRGRPISIEATMDYLLHDRGLPADRLAVGIPLYGRGFAVAEPYASTKQTPKKHAPGGDYVRISRLEKDPNWVRQWDDETKTPWLISKKDPAVIGYDDAQSVALKTDWAMKKGFRGVFFWQVHGDRMPDGTNPLQRASHRAWEKPTASSR